MPTPENCLQIAEVSPRHIDYAFFTNEKGSSAGGYRIDSRDTRNVNIYSPEQIGEGFDPADRVLANIQQCFAELEGDSFVHHQFFMTSYYAKRGKPLIVSCDNLETLFALEATARDNLTYRAEDKTDPNYLGLHDSMSRALTSSSINVIRADALIFKGIEGESISVLGAAGDAHPIMMFDDEHKIACYISGAHTAISTGVLEQSFDRMIEMGARRENIQLVIGPGLGPKSYEFGSQAPPYFSIPAGAALTFVPSTEKFLINIEELVRAKLSGRLEPEQIYNIGLDTMGIDLYQEVAEDGHLVLKKRESINFAELNRQGVLLFSARRGTMEKSEDTMTHNPGAYNTIGRHGAGFCLKGEVESPIISASSRLV